MQTVRHGFRRGVRERIAILHEEGPEHGWSISGLGVDVNKNPTLTCHFNFGPKTALKFGTILPNFIKFGTFDFLEVLAIFQHQQLTQHLTWYLSCFTIGTMKSNFLTRFERDLIPVTETLGTFFESQLANFDRRLAVEEKDGGYTLTLELAGFKNEEVDVELERGILTIEAKNARNEVVRQLFVGRDIDPDTVDAQLEHGLLTVKLSKTAAAKPRKVQVR